MKRKVCVVITARPSYARIRSALYAIKSHPELELQLVVAASALLERYGNVSKVIEKDGFTINHRVHMILEGENLTTAAKSTGLGLMELATVFDNLKPDVVVSIADRFETIATAICAAYMNIPLAHIQGGEITGSIDEKVRHSVTKLADIHLVASEQAAIRVQKMGENKQHIFVTGCPSIDIAREVAEHPSCPEDIFTTYGGVGKKIDLSSQFIVVMHHPVTQEYKQAFDHVWDNLTAIDDLQIPTLWFWPNVDAGSDGASKAIRTYREKYDLPHVHFFKNMPPEVFLSILKKSACIVGNSSVAIRECAYLGIPAVNIGTRQNGRDRAVNVIDVNYHKDKIISGIKHQLEHGHYNSDPIYGDGYAGNKIADTLASAPLVIDKTLNFTI